MLIAYFGRLSPIDIPAWPVIWPQHLINVISCQVLIDEPVRSLTQSVQRTSGGGVASRTGVVHLSKTRKTVEGISLQDAVKLSPQSVHQPKGRKNYPGGTSVSPGQKIHLDK